MAIVNLTPKNDPKKQTSNNFIQQQIDMYKRYLEKYEERNNQEIKDNVQSMNYQTPDRQLDNSYRKDSTNINRPTINQKTKIRGSKAAKNGLKLLKRI